MYARRWRRRNTKSRHGNGLPTARARQGVVDALTTVGSTCSASRCVDETVTVTAAPTQLNTSDARLGTYPQRAYTNLPLAMGTAVAGSGIGQGPIGRLIFLLPGVTEGNRWGQINGRRDSQKMSSSRASPSQTRYSKVRDERFPWGSPSRQSSNSRSKRAGPGWSLTGRDPRTIRSSQVETSFTAQDSNTCEIQSSMPEAFSRPFVRWSIKTNSEQLLAVRSSRGGSSSSAPTTDGAIE